MNTEELLFATPWPDALRPGVRLRVGRVLGCVGGGPAGHVYRVLDDLGSPIAVREYYPPSLSMRIDGRVEPLHQREAGFEAGRKRFDEDGEDLAALDHPGLLKVHKVWSENGTSYHAMPWCEGRTLEQVVRSAKAAPGERLVSTWLRAIADALAPVHRQRGAHGHLSPSHVMLLDSGRLLVMEFSRTRRFLSTDPREAERDPYMALEAGGDGRHGPTGPWTDIYAMAAIAHYALRGRPPQTPVHRSSYDVQEPLRHRLEGYSEALLHGLDGGLALRPRERPRDLPTFLARAGLPERRTRPRWSGETLLINLDLPEALVPIEPETARKDADTGFAETVPVEPELEVVGVVDVAAQVVDVESAPARGGEPPPARPRSGAPRGAAASQAASSRGEEAWPTREAPAAARAARSAPAEAVSEVPAKAARSAGAKRGGAAWWAGFSVLASLAMGAILVQDEVQDLIAHLTAPELTIPQPAATAGAAMPARGASSPIPEPLEPTAAGPAPMPPTEAPASTAAPEIAAPAQEPRAESPAAVAPQPAPAAAERSRPDAQARPVESRPAPAAAPVPAPAASPAPAAASPAQGDDRAESLSPCPDLLARQYIGRPLSAAERERMRSQCL